MSGLKYIIEFNERYKQERKDGQSLYYNRAHELASSFLNEVPIRKVQKTLHCKV